MVFPTASDRARSAARLLLLLPSVWWLAAPRVAVAQIEERCTEIDANGGLCKCSSPLDTTNLNTEIRPCEESFGGSFTPVAETAMPAGNTVDHVWARPGPSGSSNSTLWDKSPTLDERRYCIRMYKKFSPGFNAHSGTCEREKLQEMQLGTTAQLQSEVMGDGFNIFVSVGENYTRSGPQYGVADCVDHWCRFEMCFGVVSGNMYDGGTGLPEVWVLPLDGSSAESHYAIASGTPIAFAGASEDTYWGNIGNLYNQGDCTGNTRYISHGLAAGWSTNAGQRIGPAYEVEAGAATPPCDDGTCPDGGSPDVDAGLPIDSGPTRGLDGGPQLSGSSTLSGSGCAVARAPLEPSDFGGGVVVLALVLVTLTRRRTLR